VQSKLEVKVTTVIAHGWVYEFFLLTGECGHDANANIQCLCNTLQRIWDAVQEDNTVRDADNYEIPCVRRGLRWPLYLRVQLDNACGENKNRFFLAFCGLLVMLRVFKEVPPLPALSTHEGSACHNRALKMLGFLCWL
jgi:hypothetical protein